VSKCDRHLVPVLVGLFFASCGAAQIPIENHHKDWTVPQLYFQLGTLALADEFPLFVNESAQPDSVVALSRLADLLQSPRLGQIEIVPMIDASEDDKLKSLRAEKVRQVVLGFGVPAKQISVVLGSRFPPAIEEGEILNLQSAPERTAARLANAYVLFVLHSK